MVFAMLPGLEASAKAAPVITASQADTLARRQVLFRGEVVTFARVAHDFTLKLTGKDHVSDASAERFLASLILYPTEWSRVQFVQIKDREVRRQMGISGKYIAPLALYNQNGEYLPEKYFRDDGSRLDREWLKVDEKGVILAEAWSGTLLTPLAEDDPRLRSEVSIDIELAYLHTDPYKWLFMAIFTVAALSMGFGRRVWLLPAVIVMSLWGILSFVAHWVMLGRVPLDGSGNTMLLMGTLLLLICLLPAGIKDKIGGVKSSLVTAIGLVMSGAFTLSGWISLRDPSMTGLMPALASKWLPIHVSLVMAGYALLAFTAVAAVIALIKPSRSEGMEDFSRRLLPAGCVLLLAGIIIGSIWAKEAWGSYWQWDPKENWAAITLILYAVPIIAGRRIEVRLRNGAMIFHIWMLVCLLSMAMTYFGVNFLNSVHAYA